MSAASAPGLESVLTAPGRMLGRRLAGAGGPHPGVRALVGSGAARAQATLARVDYQDAFSVELGPVAAERGAEEWIREVIEGAPDALRRRLVPGWKALGLRIGDPVAPDRVLGWGVRRTSDDAVTLGARSRIGMPAELVLLRHEESLLFSTMIQFRNPAARLLWAPVEAPHLEVVADILARARRRCLTAER